MNLCAHMLLCLAASVAATVGTAPPTSAPAASQPVEIDPYGAFTWTEVFRSKLAAAEAFHNRYERSAEVAWMSPTPLGVIAVEPLGTGQLDVFLAQADEPAGRDLRVVFIDDQGSRHVCTRREMKMTARRRSTMTRFQRFSATSPDDIREIVLEQRVPVTDEAALARLSPLPPLVAGQPYPFSLPAVEDGRIESAAFAGKVVVLHIWTTWHTPCVSHLPRLKQLYDRYHKEGLEIIGVDLADEPAEVREFVRKYDIPWPQAILNDKQSEIAATVTAINTMPRYLVLDQRGRLYRNVSADDLEAVLQTLLTAPSSGATAPATQTPASRQATQAPSPVLVWTEIFHRTLNPDEARPWMWADSIGVISIQPLPEGQLQIFLSRSSTSDQPLRAIFVDDQGRRHVCSQRTCAISGPVRVIQFEMLTSLPRPQIRKMIFEQQTLLDDQQDPGEALP